MQTFGCLVVQNSVCEQSENIDQSCLNKVFGQIFQLVEIHQVPCEGGLRMTLIWRDITQSYITWILLENV